VSLSVADGELLAVLGPSGSGKSTLLRVCAGLEAADAGRVLVGGRDVTAAAPSARGLAMVFQSFALFPHLSVEENVGFGLAARGEPRELVRERVREVAGRLELDGLLARRPSQLSGGERQRVALARALAGRPRVLLLDEPLSNLDAQLRASARAELRRLHAETGTTMVYVTHDQAEALALGDRVAVLRAGALEQVGTPEAVYDRPATRFVAGFVGTPPMNLVDGRVEGGRAVADPLSVAAPAGARDGDAVTVGVRPEHLLPGREGFEAEIEDVERGGHDRVWGVRAGERRLLVRPPAEAAGEPGERIRLAPAAAGVRLFGTDGRAL